MRTVLSLVALLLASEAHAASCEDLTDRITKATAAEVTQRTHDFVSFEAAEGVTLSLSCGGEGYPSSVGAQSRVEEPPERYYSLFGQAAQAVTGISADTLRDAAQRARADAARLRHSNVEAGGVLVTCSFTRAEKGPLTMCAAIERAERS